MKKLIYKLINKFGYRIENKKKARQELIEPLKKFSHLDNFNLIVLAKNYVLNLDNKFDGLSIVNHKEGFLIRFSELEIYIESLEEFHILNEVFINDDYRFSSNSKSILIDIGANIGISSLFFSRCKYINKIFAFEPVKDTYDQAQYNLKLNEKINKVEWIKNVGLGRNNRKESFLFDSKTKGNTGIRGKLSPSYLENEFAIKREVQICDASVEINKILKTVNDEKIIIKMDCEGAEYEILDNLFESGVIDQIDVLLLEWHDNGVEEIEKLLLESGFNLFVRDLDPISGMVYAYKN